MCVSAASLELAFVATAARLAAVIGTFSFAVDQGVVSALFCHGKVSRKNGPCRLRSVLVSQSKVDLMKGARVGKETDELLGHV